MTKFYLHITNGHIETEDQEGQEFENLAAARTEAVHSIRSLISEDVLHGKLDISGNITIHDEQDRPIEKIAFLEAIEISSSHEFAVEKSNSAEYATGKPV